MSPSLPTLTIPGMSPYVVVFVIHARSQCRLLASRHITPSVIVVVSEFCVADTVLTIVLIPATRGYHTVEVLSSCRSIPPCVPFPPLPLLCAVPKRLSCLLGHLSGQQVRLTNVFGCTTCYDFIPHSQFTRVFSPTRLIVSHSTAFLANVRPGSPL